jgi:hypothetical protein
MRYRKLTGEISFGGWGWEPVKKETVQPHNVKSHYEIVIKPLELLNVYAHNE